MSSSGATEYKYWFEGLMPKQHEAVVNFLVQMQLQGMQRSSLLLGLCVLH